MTMTRMLIHRRAILTALLAFASVAAAPFPALAQNDPLPLWNDGPAKKAIVDFVLKVTRDGGPDFVPESQRIAVFDNDGTLWSEQPMYVQLAFVVDRIKAMASQHPEWKDKQPYKAVLENDIEVLAKSGEKGLAELLMATHAGMSAEEFTAIATDWIKTAKHPKTDRPYTEMIYQPMLELLAYLRANGFKTFIVSGGGIEFMRPWTEATYGIPPEQVVGSSIKTKYEVKNGKPTLIRLPEVNFVDDKAGKPVGIYTHIGRRPIAAFGNSDGDFEMIEWTTAGSGARLGVILHHDDAAREFAYDRTSHIGKLDRGLDEAPKRGWTVIGMKDDWKRVFKFR
jgi:phosphoglycolate phosphatase-like HAD superfamily hydrolase